MSWLIADLTNIPTPKNDNFESILSKILAWSYSQHKITKLDMETIVNNALMIPFMLQNVPIFLQYVKFLLKNY